MTSARMEAFSDGVIAIIITIMVLELRSPREASVSALRDAWPTFSAYALSFTIVAIYWVNHHHLLQSSELIDKKTLWLNIHWLFWLSLFPVTTEFIGDTRGAPLAIATYSILSVLVAMSFFLLQRSLITLNEHIEELAASSRRRYIKNVMAMGSMIAAVPLAFVSRPTAVFMLVVPALAYFLPE